MKKLAGACTALSCVALFGGLGLPSRAQHNPSGQAQRLPDKARLRQLVPLPSMKHGFGFHGSLRFSDDRDILPPTEEIMKLQREMRGSDADAARYYRLGQVYVTAEAEKLAEKSFRKAAELYRSRVRAKPGDVLLLAHFAQALNFADQIDEALTVSRQAVERAPRQWRAWVARGDAAASKGLRLLWGDAFAQVKPSDLESLQRLGAAMKKPTPEQAAQAETSFKEARQAYDRAVALAPEKWEAYEERLLFLQVNAMNQALQEILGGRADAAAMAAAVFPAEGITDVQRISLLRPGSVDAAKIAILSAALIPSLQKGQAPDISDPTFWAGLPEGDRQFIRQAMARLETLSKSKSRNAAAAAELRGLFLYLSEQNLPESETSLRRALSLDPSRDDAWMTLGAVLSKAERFQDLAIAAQQRLKTHDTARNHVVLARAYSKLNQADKALSHAQIARTRSPEDITAGLTLAALLLKHGTDDAALSRANETLLQLRTKVEKAGEAEWMRDYLLLAGIAAALDGDLEVAKALLKQVLVVDEDA